MTHVRALAALGLVVATAAAALAVQELPPFMQRGRPRGEPANLEPGQVPYDGSFVFARLRYTMDASGEGLGGFRRRGGFRREPPWAHDYPRAERNFMKILDEITTADAFETFLTLPAYRAID